VMLVIFGNSHPEKIGDLIKLFRGSRARHAPG